MSAFGSGSNSNGNFWYGNSTNFPGFLYKKNVGVGGRRSTKMGPGGNITCNSATDLYNKYKPGGGGVGASSIANRRAKNRLATVCSGQKCFPCYMTLGQYSNYTHNPNGYVPCLAPPPCSSVTLADIATFDGINWLLNGDTTILACQTLEIPAGQELQTNHFTLTNNGTINVRGTIRNDQDTPGNNSVTINNGIINIFSTGTIVAVNVTVVISGSIITNNGIINNYGDFFCQTYGIINNNAGGRINNYSAFSGTTGTGGFRLNFRGTFNNVGVFINNTGATINNAFDATIYNNNGGIITNNGTFTNNGDIYNPTVSTTCGIGTITGTITGTQPIDACS